MARGGKSSPAEVFLEIASKLPWWMSLVLAGISYLVLHTFANQPFKPVTPVHVAEAIFAVAGAVTWLAEFVQVEWLGGNAHLVAIGAFLVGVYELLYGAGICLFRTGMLGVLIGGYAFGAFCLYGMLHWTLG